MHLNYNVNLPHPPSFVSPIIIFTEGVARLQTVKPGKTGGGAFPPYDLYEDVQPGRVWS